MYNTKFILGNNQEVYPGYLDKESREKLKQHFGEQRSFMRCGCKPEGELYYRISEDLKIYPEHQNYVHDKYCSRYKESTGITERQTAYLINEEDGEVTAYVTFNPKEFSLTNSTEKEQDNELSEEDEELQDEAVIEKEDGASKPEEKKEPKLSLPGLIRSINVDSYTEKILNNNEVESKDKFNKNVYFRMKKVRISRQKKKIGELTLEKDGVRFIYLPFFNFTKEEKAKGLTKCYIQTLGANGEVYNNFIYPETLEKAIKEYMKAYGQMPDEKNTMISGFQYYKKGKSKSMYKVLGRIHLFQTSDLGIYCRSLIERDTYNTLCRITKEDKNIRFWIPPEDDSVAGIIQIKGMEKKILLLFRTKKSERVTFDSSVYEPLVIGEESIIAREGLYNLIKK